MKKPYIVPSIQNFRIQTSSMLALSGGATTEETANGSDAMSNQFQGGFLWEDDSKE